MVQSGKLLATVDDFRLYVKTKMGNTALVADNPIAMRTKPSTGAWGDAQKFAGPQYNVRPDGVTNGEPTGSSAWSATVKCLGITPRNRDEVDGNWYPPIQFIQDDLQGAQTVRFGYFVPNHGLQQNDLLFNVGRFCQDVCWAPEKTAIADNAVIRGKEFFDPTNIGTYINKRHAILTSNFLAAQGENTVNSNTVTITLPQWFMPTGYWITRVAAGSSWWTPCIVASKDYLDPPTAARTVTFRARSIYGYSWGASTWKIQIAGIYINNYNTAKNLMFQGKQCLTKDGLGAILYQALKRRKYSAGATNPSNFGASAQFDASAMRFVSLNLVERNAVGTPNVGVPVINLNRATGGRKAIQMAHFNVSSTPLSDNTDVVLSYFDI